MNPVYLLARMLHSDAKLKTSITRSLRVIKYAAVGSRMDARGIIEDNTLFAVMRFHADWIYASMSTFICLEKYGVYLENKKLLLTKILHQLKSFSSKK